jgi:hypothetical protein
MARRADQSLQAHRETAMNRLILAAALALGAIGAAHADTSTYVWQRGGAWNDAELQAAAQVCDAHYGVVMNGAITSANYKRCMLAQGWRYQSTARVQTFIDPDTGMSCQDEGGGAVCVPPQGTVHYFDSRKGLPCTRTGLISVCSNVQ